MWELTFWYKSSNSVYFCHLKLDFWHLWIFKFDKIKNVPKGIFVKDGNDILDKSEIFTYKNGSYSAFSNLFRFTLLYKNGGYWADTDLICMKSLKDFDKEEDVIEMANSTKYGLAASIFTQDVSKAHRVAAKIKSIAATIIAKLPCMSLIFFEILLMDDSEKDFFSSPK